MDKKDLIEILDKEFRPLGFKRKGNYWQHRGTEIIKIIYLQKSSFSNLYYLNYGFNFVNLNYQETLMHIFRRLSSTDNNENKLIKSLLDFESNIDFATRKVKLIGIIQGILKKELNRINSEKDILKELEEKLILLNTLPLKVKEYLKV